MYHDHIRNHMEPYALNNEPSKIIKKWISQTSRCEHLKKPD